MNEQKELISKMMKRLESVKLSNAKKEQYYNAQVRLKDLGIGLPPGMGKLKAAVDWPKVIIDTVAERIQIKGVTHSDFALNEWIQSFVNEQNVITEIDFAIKDSMIYGVGFLMIHSGDVESGEPEVLVSSESPSMMTAQWDSRTGKITSALRLIPGQESYSMHDGYVLMTEDSTVTYDKHGEIIHVDNHGMGRVPVVRIVNNARSSAVWGKSDITPAIRYLTDAAIRTIVAMEVSREFFSSPQRWILGADESLFTDEDGNQIPAWESFIGRYLAIDRDEDGNLPQIGTFAASSPEPYLAILDTLAQQCASAGSIPDSYLGQNKQSIPSSADAIRVRENSLVSKIGAKLPTIKSSIQEVFSIIFSFVGIPVEEPVNVSMASPQTPTPASTADMLVKLIQVGAFSSTSDFVYESLGLSPAQIAQSRAEVAKVQASSILQKIQSLGQEARADEDVQQMDNTARSGGQNNESEEEESSEE